LQNGESELGALRKFSSQNRDNFSEATPPSRREHNVLCARDADALGSSAKPHLSTQKEAMKTDKTAYRSAVGLALAAAFILLWLMGAVGVIGVEGDRADLMYFGVLAVGVIGAIIARFQPHGMARALFATALAQALVAVIALIAGKHQAPISSVAEILGLNGIFVALFLGSAWLFRYAGQEQPGRAGRGQPKRATGEDAPTS
jgi:hypothetical protein